MTQAPFRLTPAQRQKLKDGVDAAALERLLTALPPHARQRALPYFIKSAAAIAVGDAIPFFIDFDNPALEQLHAAVWAAKREQLKTDPEFWRDAEFVDRLESPVAVALAAEIPDARATATVVRRDNPEPRELILLRQDTANGLIWAAALFVLQLARQRSSPDKDRTTLRHVRDPMAIDATWPEIVPHMRELIEQLDDRLAQLRRADPQIVAGVGRVVLDVFRWVPAGTRKYPPRDPRWTPRGG